jgi:hypothetical protein
VHSQQLLLSLLKSQRVRMASLLMQHGLSGNRATLVSTLFSVAIILCLAFLYMEISLACFSFTLSDLFCLLSIITLQLTGSLNHLYM